MILSFLQHHLYGAAGPHIIMKHGNQILSATLTGFRKISNHMDFSMFSLMMDMTGVRMEGHYWIENWNKTFFPHGPEWLAQLYKIKGIAPGLWLVPNSYAGSFEQHPDWYLYDKSGNVIKDYRTPALDHTNPAVQEWLKKLFTTLKGLGI